ncbi:MAG: Serine/threonine-protein kinase PrkC [Planctomycetota bacterium]|jgi:serine/threonine protein kinase
MRFTFVPESRPLEGYTIKRAIHRGGFGEVYYALSDAGKEVALKLLHNNMEVELRGVSQCLNLKHPNLVTIFDIRQDSEQEHWIVMEYVGGQSLYDVLCKHPSGMPLSEILTWLDGMTAGLSFLHDRGLVHRDLKPANIFSDAGIVKIGDVGLSKYISDSRRSAQTQSVGTVYYMAPEVARGRYGREVDVYSMGIMLCEMMTGHVPFEGETTAEILMKHLTAEPDLTRLPHAVRTVLAAALEKDPAQRIPSVDLLRQQFVEAITNPQSANRPKVPATPPPTATQTHVSNSAATSSSRPDGEFPPAQLTTMARLQQFFDDRIPYSVKWMLSIAFLTLLINSGTTGPRNTIPEILVISIILGALGAWLLPSAKSRLRTAVDHMRSRGPATSNVPPVIASSDPAVPARGNAIHQRPKASPVILRNASPTTVRIIPVSQRLVTMTSSMALSLSSVLVVSLLLYFATPVLPSEADALFFAIATLLVTWAVIIPSRLMEGTRIEPWYRRIILGGFGASAGLVVGKMARFLMLEESTMLKSSGRGYLERLSSLSTETNTPTVAGFVIFLTLLFFVRRWWWQADSFRKQRLRIASALATAFIAMLLARLTAFPVTFAGTLALAVSVVVQLSSAWTPIDQRFLSVGSAETGGRR